MCRVGSYSVPAGGEIGNQAPGDDHCPKLRGGSQCVGAVGDQARDTGVGHTTVGT